MFFWTLDIYVDIGFMYYYCFWTFIFESMMSSLRFLCVLDKEVLRFKTVALSGVMNYLSVVEDNDCIIFKQNIHSY